MQRNPHSYQIATGYRTFYSLSLIYQPITKKRLFLNNKSAFFRQESHCYMYLPFQLLYFQQLQRSFSTLAIFFLKQ